MENTVLSEYFLGANSAEGFYSHFGDSYSADWTAYIIKGGAGTGKSTLMRRFAEKAKANGVIAELCPCSSDPDSLDAVILPSKKTIILDGTAPHTVEPKYPGLCEQIINTGDYWDSAKLKECSAEILNIMKENKAYHKKASAYITACGQLKKFNFTHALNLTDINACFNFGANLAKRHIKKNGQKAHEWVRFLSGITPKGYIFLSNTLTNFSTKIVLKDEYGAAASIILSAIKDYALYKNHEIIIVKNPILPSDITDAVILPELDIVFIREEFENINCENKKHNVHRFYNADGLKRTKEKIKFNKKAYFALLDAAAQTLAKAKATHDRLEKYYINAMDYSRLNKFFNDFLEKV